MTDEGKAPDLVAQLEAAVAAAKDRAELEAYRATGVKPEEIPVLIAAAFKRSAPAPEPDSWERLVREYGG